MVIIVFRLVGFALFFQLVISVQSPTPFSSFKLNPIRHAREYWLVRVLNLTIACLLTISSLSKLWVVVSDPFADLTLGFPVPVIWMVIVIELFVVYENVRDQEVTARTWFHNLCVFCCFLSVGAFRYFHGDETCGCLGIELPLTVTLGLSFTIMTLLVLVPVIKGDNVADKLIEGILAFATYPVGIDWSGAATVLATCIALMLLFEQPTRLDGSLRVEMPENINLAMGEFATVDIKLTNLSQEPKIVRGVRSSCNCVLVSSDLPKTLHQGDSYVETVKVRPTRVGSFHQRVSFFVEDDRLRRFHVEVIGDADF